jgi:type VI secretion system ImpM family protein
MKTLPPGCFGKLPLHGDFIASARGYTEIGELDRWLQEGMAAASQKLGNAWPAAFEAAPTARFLFRSSGTGRLLAGVWKRSRDRVGRQFPMILFVMASEPVAGAQVRTAVASHAGFFAAAEALLDRDWRTGDAAGFLAAVAQLPATDPAVALAAAPETSGELLGLVAGPFGDPRRSGLVANLVELKRSEVPRLLLRFPVGELRGEIGIWLDYLACLGNGAPALTIWAQGPARSLQSWFPPPAARMFLPAFLPDRMDATVFDLALPGVSPAGAQDRARIEHLAADPGLPVEQWLDELRALVKRPARGEA